MYRSNLCPLLNYTTIYTPAPPINALIDLANAIHNSIPCLACLSQNPAEKVSATCIEPRICHLHKFHSVSTKPI